MNPFLVLDVPVTATDEVVRAAYQRLLRRFSPEHRPEEFQMIQEAYQALRTARDRWQWRLFHLPKERTGPLRAVETFARMPGRARPPGAAAFRAFLGACATSASRQPPP
jgi:DnaJ-class molecular chaperone